MSAKKRKNKNKHVEVSAVPPAEPALTTPPLREGKSHIAFLFVLLAVAAIYRLVWLGRAELWQDELGFLKYSHTGWTLNQVLKNSWELVLSIGQMPFAFAVHNVVYRIMELVTAQVTPFTAGLARFPDAIFGIVGVWACYRLATRIFDPALARLSAFGVATMFFPVYYARELYVYAQMWILAPLSILYLVDVLKAGKIRARDAILAVLMLAALLYTHLGSLMFAVAIGVVLFLFWVSALKAKNGPQARRVFVAMLLTGAALALASPYVLRFVLFNKAHTGGSEYSIWVILNDGVSKLFMGERPVMSAISWAALLLGLVSLVMPHSERRSRILVAGVTVLAMIGITWATKRSQYLSARYFTPVAPLMLLVMLQGVWQAGLWVGALFKVSAGRRWRAGFALVLLPILVHAFFFTPMLLRLREKSTSFGAAARWINENLESGVPYLMESAYERRWVGESFPTPGHHPVAPFVHGGGIEQMNRLHERQVEFMMRFPEAAFVESAHHNWDTPIGLWKWPHEHFAQRVLLGDPEATKHLIRLGIFPGFPHEVLSDYTYRVDIYYNTFSDRVARARSSTLPVLTIPEGWALSGQQVSSQETLYFRVGRPLDSSIRILNVGAIERSGYLVLSVGTTGPANSMTEIAFRTGDDVLAGSKIPSGRFVAVKIPIHSLPVGETRIYWRASSPADANLSLLLYDAKWVAE